MKRLFAMSCLAVLVLAAAGCGGGSSDSTTGSPGGSTESAATTTESAAVALNEPLECDESPSADEAVDWPVPKADKPYKVTLMEVSLGAYYYVGIDYGAHQAAEEAGVDLDTVAGQGYTSPEAQLQQAEDAIQGGAEALVMAPSDVKGSVPVVEYAKANDVPVVNISSEVDSPDVYSVQQDDYKLGVELAKQLAETVGPNGGEGIYVVGPETATFAMKRQAGFTEELEKNHPGIEIAAMTHTLVEPAEGLKAFEDAVAAHPDIQWIASNGYILLPPEALPEQYKGKIPYVGMQYEPESIKALEAGTLSSVFGIEPISMGRIGVARAIELLNGDTPPKMTCIPAPLFTKKDIGTPLADKELVPAGYKP